jgi:hypothetical protein
MHLHGLQTHVLGQSFFWGSLVFADSIFLDNNNKVKIKNFFFTRSPKKYKINIFFN